MPRPAIPVLIAAMLAAGCSSTVPLQSSNTGVSGTLARNLFEPHVLEVELDGKRYRGDWHTLPPTRDQVAAAPYPHRKQLGRVIAELRADDGSHLNCKWETRGSKARGSCMAGRTAYAVDIN